MKAHGSDMGFGAEPFTIASGNLSMLHLLSQTSPAIEQVTSFGVAGLMGAMWLWERRTSRQREQQIDEAHARIMADRIQLDQLIDVVRSNTEVMSRLSATQEQLVREMGSRRG
jgi:hypothetical protein